MYDYHYSLEVVSNGSEEIEPVLLLSVSRCVRTNDGNSNAILESIPIEDSIVRYAVLGLSDMTARLVADQKISWANTKAIFCHNNHRHAISSGLGGCCPSMGVNGGGSWGLQGCLLALYKAGAPDLTIVTGNEEDASCTEAMVQLLEANKTHPQIRISAVPLTTTTTNNNKQGRKDARFWKVYEDPYLIVHGTCHDRLEHLIYLFTCRRHHAVSNYTLAVLPCPRSWQLFLDIWTVADSRVVIPTRRTGDVEGPHQILPIKVVLAVGDDSAANTSTFLDNIRGILPDASVFFCRPQERDDGILLRAKESLQAWHSALPNNIMQNSFNNNALETNLNGTSLASCSSVIFSSHPATVIDRSATLSRRITKSIPDPADVRRLRAFFDTPENGMADSQDANEIDLDDLEGESSDSEDRPEIESSQNCTDEYEKGATETSSTRKEINTPLVMASMNCPHLLVLGTGCAAPSPLRGSSAYGLLLPQILEQQTEARGVSNFNEALVLSAIIECGEGTINALLRHLPTIDSSITDSKSNLQLHLAQTKFIWISHSHYDHYGGLPSVISKIHEARMHRHQRWERQQVEHQRSKRQRLQPADPPVLVVAPRKVLDYLAIALRSKNHEQLFRGYTHQQFRSWWPPLASTQIARRSQRSKIGSYAYRPYAFWTNVRVEHSCHDAFGFVMGVRVPNIDFEGDLCGSDNGNQTHTPIVSFGYSGDTRPCWAFVQQCKKHCNALNYLLHEASFCDEDHAKALEKKHSSLSEALKVAEDTRAQKLVLTHFSQRYYSYPPMSFPAASNDTAAVFAMDGMLIPLQ